MASEELHLESRPEGDGSINNTSSATVTYVEGALKALTIQSDSGKDNSDIVQHANGSRCAQIAVGNTETQIISSDFKETNLNKSISEGKEVSDKTAEERQNVIRQKVDQYNAIAGEKLDSDINKLEGLCISSNVEETGNQNSNCMQVANTEKELLKELKLLQCPFTWNLNFKNVRTTTETLIANCNDKLKLLQDEIDEDDDEGFEWRRFILTLTLCYEHSISGSSSEALSKIQECENLINKCQSSEKPDAFFQNVKEALLHVVNASKCHLLVSLNMFNDAVKLKHNISRYENMSRQNIAAIFGIQSSMLMEYGFEGTKSALEYAQKAVHVDGDEAEWHFLCGKILGRIRRVENFTEIPSQEELSALEQAVKTRKNSARIVFLAQAYREAASKAFGKNRNNLDSLKDMLTKMNEKSLQLYWEALELNGNSARVNIRCAAGLLKLPAPFQDLKKAEECIEKALKLAPNNAMANHIAGNLCEKLSKFDLAEKYYKRSGELGAYGAYMNLLTMKINKNRKYDPLPELQEMLQKFTEESRIQETYLQMGSYLFYFKNDTFAALDYWMKGIELNPNAEKLKAHKCSFLFWRTSVNLYQVIVDETRLALEANSVTDEDILKLRKILLYCTEKYPELLTNKPQAWRQHSVKEQGRRRNQTNGRGARQWHRSKHPEQWRSESREESSCNNGKSSRSNPSTSRKNDCQNKDHSLLQQHENWRCNPRNVQFSDQACGSLKTGADSISVEESETCNSLKRSTGSMSNVENAPTSTEDNGKNLGCKRNWNQQRRGMNKGFTRSGKWQTNAQEEHQRQQSHCRGSWRNKDYHSSPQQRVHQNEIQHGRKKNEDNEFGKCNLSEKH